MRSTSACGGSHLVAQAVSGGLHSFLGAGAQRGANAALAGTGHGFSEMHTLSIFGDKVWALNIEKKSAVRLCKTWQDKLSVLFLVRKGLLGFLEKKKLGKRRFSQESAGTRRKPQIGVCPLKFVPLSAALAFFS